MFTWAPLIEIHDITISANEAMRNGSCCTTSEILLLRWLKMIHFSGKKGSGIKTPNLGRTRTHTHPKPFKSHFVKLTMSSHWLNANVQSRERESSYVRTLLNKILYGNRSKQSPKGSRIMGRRDREQVHLVQAANREEQPRWAEEYGAQVEPIPEGSSWRRTSGRELLKGRWWAW